MKDEIEILINRSIKRGKRVNKKLQTEIDSLQQKQNERNGKRLF